MKEMDLDKLNRIQPVDAPPYLFTRIREKIRTVQSETVSKQLVWSLSFSFMLLIGLNVRAIISSTQPEGVATSIVQEMNLSANNDLYR